MRKRRRDPTSLNTLCRTALSRLAAKTLAEAMAPAVRGREALRELDRLKQGWLTATRTVLRNVASTCVAGGEQARMPRGTGREKTHTPDRASCPPPT